MEQPSTSNTEHNHIRRTPSHASQSRSIASAGTQRTDVFSDEFALERADTGEMTPTDHHAAVPANPAPPRIVTSDPSQSTNQPQETIPEDAESGPSAIQSSKDRPNEEPSSSRPNSQFFPHHESDPRRSLSISSEFTAPRAPSPYNGPTAPSQPYGMYPQIARASSVASASTVQPVERPFIPQGGPEHPYAMYQNTVPEEEDGEGEGSNSLPHGGLMGTSAIGSSFAGGSSSSGNDTGDIVGSDGHVEQLPPYTRYADNVVAKGDMAQINQDVPAAPEQHSPSLTDASLLTPNQSGSEAEINPPSNAEEEQEVARKEGWYEKSKRRKCCGIPVIIVVLLVVIIFISAAVGGVVGGIVGNRKGVDHANAASASTTTMWLDADPVETGPSTPPCPTGHFSAIPFDNVGNINQCVQNPSLKDTWGCLETASLGITILPEQQDDGDYTITFDDYSNLPKLFSYGPQPPDFNGTKFPLDPVEDRDNRDYGVALFFSYLFDKIVILPETALNATGSYGKRSRTKPRINSRARYGGYLREGDQPWYCYWNQTVEEFWIFLEQEVGTSAASSNVSAVAIMTSTPAGYPKSATPSTPQSSTTAGSTTGPTSSTTAAPMAKYAEEVVYEAGPPPPAPTFPNGYGRYHHKRAAVTSGSRGSVPVFPNMIKMVEKRKPFGNIEPYCQQMVVLDDFAGIVPKENGAIINIEEEEFSNYPYASTVAGDSTADVIGDLESLCVCEWRFPGP